MTTDTIESAYRDRRVLVTGHSGFKGGWLTAWLEGIGARVTGISLPPDQGPHNLFERAKIATRCESRFLDIRDSASVEQIVHDVQPEVMFHLAAQSLVNRSYRRPLDTFGTNILGVAHILEAARKCESVRGCHQR
jgi:CDP-glucose 4,6-dehydratase